MPKVVPEYRAQARERILKAARRTFLRHGFRGATMESVAREVGVSKGALYLYFRSKTALLEGIQELARQKIERRLEPLLASDDVAEGLAELLEEAREQNPEPAIWINLIAEATTDATLRRTLRVDMREDVAALASFFRRLGMGGRFPELGDPETTAYIVMLLFQGTFLGELMGREIPEARAYLVRSLRLVLGPQLARRRAARPRRVGPGSAGRPSTASGRTRRP